MKDVLNLPASGTQLDAGGGTGRVAVTLRPFLDNVLVADISTGMLAQARAKGLPALSLETEHLPLADNAFERVLMVDALHHVTHQAETLRELYRVLKPGGRLVVEEPDIRTFAVKLIALAEKLALMRSHFLAPDEIAALFPAEAQIKIEAQDHNVWVIVEKPGDL
jgi:demethylmenaquinone methyltransferase/2-methoxy-6-polyprenyl-1,4-benzoquinol methylase